MVLHKGSVESICALHSQHTGFITGIIKKLVQVSTTNFILTEFRILGSEDSSSKIFFLPPTVCYFLLCGFLFFVSTLDELVLKWSLESMQPPSLMHASQEQQTALALLDAETRTLKLANSSPVFCVQALTEEFIACGCEDGCIFVCAMEVSLKLKSDLQIYRLIFT